MAAKYKVKQLPDGSFRAMLALPGAKGVTAYVSGTAATKADAMGKAVQVAQQVLDSPVGDLLPPGARPALEQALKVASWVRSGQAKAAYQAVKSKSVKKLIKALF